MIVRQYSSAPRADIFASHRSRRLVSPEDRMGHLLFDTTIEAGERDNAAAPAGMTAQAHYCVAGRAVATIAGRRVVLFPGKLIAAGDARACTIAARERLKICSVYGVADEQGVFVERSLAEIEGTERDVYWGAGYSKRLLVRRDGLGFAFCVTIGHADRDSSLQYRNHLETCYYIQGAGEYVWRGGSHRIRTGNGEGTAFVMNRHDAHRMVIREESVCLSIFTPAIEGSEAHDFTKEAASSY
ncbi:MAG: hypothetical protein EA385_10370 [Salinarimonadaceae bacterium]|nr:MAG: hypothetical protein EA385_10370 [Salinarimonadaceae bacterium]